MKPFTKIKDPDLRPRLAEAGKIKIGGKGAKRQAQSGRDYQLPIKYDHFVVTTLEKDGSGNFTKDQRVHEQIGEKPKELGIVLLHDDPAMNFPCRYALYTGRRCWCQGDGEKAERIDEKNWKERKEIVWREVTCPCEKLDKEGTGTNGNAKCKPHGVLSVMLAANPTLGAVYKFRTTSWNSISQVLGAMEEISAVTQGILAGLPLMLKIRPKSAVVGDTMQTIYTVHLETPEGGLDKLLQIAHDVGRQRAVSHRELKALKMQIDGLLLAAPQGETEEDIEAEFYPENNGDTVDGTATAVDEAETTPKIDNLPLAGDSEPQEEEAPPPDDDACPFDDGEGPPPEHITAAQRNEIFALANKIIVGAKGDALKDAIKALIKKKFYVPGEFSLSEKSDDALSFDIASQAILDFKIMIDMEETVDASGVGQPTSTTSGGDGPPTETANQGEEESDHSGSSSSPDTPESKPESDPERDKLILWLEDAIECTSGAKFLADHIVAMEGWDRWQDADRQALAQLKADILAKSGPAKQKQRTLF